MKRVSKDDDKKQKKRKRLEESNHGVQVFKMSRLKELARENGYGQLCKEEEDRRCAADLMYKIFKRPETCVPLLYTKLKQLIETKYAPKLLESRMYTHAMKFTGDLKIQVFFLLLIIAEEDEAQAVIKAGYDAENCLWGIRGPTRFQNVYIPILKLIIDQGFRESFGEVTVTPIVTWVLKEAEKAYMMK